jgi:integrase
MPRPRQARPALTKRTVDAAEPREQRYLLFDGAVHGFALKVEPSGTKSFVVQKSQLGRSVRVTIGTYPDLTVEQARREAQRIVVELVRGGDPTAEKRAAIVARRQADRDAITVTDLWNRYAADEIAVHNKPATAALKHRMWTKYVKPVVGGSAVRDVTGNDMAEILRLPLRFDSKGQLVGGKGEAGNLYRLLHHLFTRALAWRMRPLELGHPLDGIEPYRLPRRERLLSDDELHAILAAAERDDGAEQVRTAVKLAALTGWRIMELLTLRWEYLRPDLGEAHLPETKIGFSVRPLSPAAWAILHGVERRLGVPWVLPGVRSAEVHLDYDTVEKGFRRIAAGAGVDGVTLHTLRHRFTTDVAGAAPNIRTGMAVTGHKSVQAFLGYVHAERDRAKAVAAEVTGKVAALAARPPREKIVELKPKRGFRRG